MRVEPGPLAADRLLRMQALVLDSMREGVSVSDEDGFIIYTNPAEDRMFGYEPGELIGRHVTIQNTYPPDENARIVKEVIARLNAEGMWEGEFANVRKDGSAFVTHARITALQLDGRPYWVCVQEDVSVRRREEHRLRAMQDVTARLSAALTPEQVAGVIIEHALSAVGAQAGSVLRLAADGSYLQVTRSAGYASGYESRWARVSIERRIAITEAVRTRTPVFIDSEEEWDARFEKMGPVRALAGSCAWAALPLIVDDRVLGTMALSFVSRDALDPASRAAMIAIAQQCAQALERARLGEDDRLMRERLRLATEAGHIGTFDWHLPSGRVSWSEEMERVFGLRPGTFEGTFDSFAARVLDEDRESISRLIGESMARHDDSFEVTFRIRRADGAIRWLDGRGVIVYDDGTPLRIVGVNIDVTGRRRAQEGAELLAEASRLLGASLDPEATLRNLARSAVPGLADWCGIDIIEEPEREEWPPRVRRVVTMNQDPARVEIAEQLRQRFPQDWTRDGGLPSVLRHGVTEFHPDVPDELLRASARDAEQLRMLQALQLRAVIVAPLVARGRVLGALTLAMAESDRRFDEADRALAEDLARRAGVAVDNARLYQAAQDASRAKTQFLATMSHELRTPLNAIDGYAELMELGIHGPVSEAQREALARVRRSQRHLLGLINEVLNYARVEAGAVRYELADVRVADVLGAVEGMVAPQLRAKGLSYEVARCDAGLALRADEEKVQQILVNLLTNAVKFTPSGGRVRVSCEPRGEMVEIRVADSGVGIPTEKLEAIFEPFVQVDARLTRTQEGVGLGLAISRDLARGMGGDISAASEPGNGAVFTVVLPRASG